MKKTKSIDTYENFYFKADIISRCPDSGFSLSFGDLNSGVFTTGVVFSGRSGLIFDQSGNFFGGYYSGRSFNLEGHFFGDRLSYFYDGVLMNNNLTVTTGFNAIEFDKFDRSSLNIDLYYIN